MSIVVPDLGEKYLLKTMLQTALATDEPLHLHLFKNNYTPNRESELDDFVEADYSGYAIIQLDRSEWRDPVTMNGVAVTLYGLTPLSWVSASGTQTVHGYYVTNEADDLVIWAERFVTPALITTSSGPVLVFLMRLHSELEPAPP